MCHHIQYFVPFTLANALSAAHFSCFLVEVSVLSVCP